MNPKYRSVLFLAMVFVVMAPYLGFVMYYSQQFPPNHWPSWFTNTIAVWFIKGVMAKIVRKDGGFSTDGHFRGDLFVHECAGSAVGTASGESDVNRSIVQVNVGAAGRARTYRNLSRAWARCMLEQCATGSSNGSIWA